MPHESRIISNFEINQKEGKVVLFINPKIFPLSIVKKAASSFEKGNWVTIDGDPKEDLMVEIKPREKSDLEAIGRGFNNQLLEISTKDLIVDEKDSALISRIRGVIKEFLAEEKGRITKESVIALSVILGAIGLGSLIAQEASANHACSPPDSSCGSDGSCCGTGDSGCDCDSGGSSDGGCDGGP